MTRRKIYAKFNLHWITHHHTSPNEERERERERFTEDFISSFLAKNKFIQTSTALKQN
jgi:hypothetical protein